MSSPNHSTSDIEDAFSSMNILNYTSVSSDYFPASSGSISFNSSENSNIIPSVISPFYNNPCLKDVQAFYAKEQNLNRLQMANTHQPKSYDSKLINDNKVKLNLYDTKETLNEGEES
ncbi:hypothetical protein Tco_1031699 [Tanacetum coccineum]|uniref:Uncharacterized protein n=1 Tax=Tanacetum coccineum TaxID=301880 RepID=A0ABQ5GBE4_9ASTR